MYLSFYVMYFHCYYYYITYTEEWANLQNKTSCRLMPLSLWPGTKSSTACHGAPPQCLGTRGLMLICRVCCIKVYLKHSEKCNTSSIVNVHYYVTQATCLTLAGHCSFTGTSRSGGCLASTSVYLWPARLSFTLWWPVRCSTTGTAACV